LLILKSANGTLVSLKVNDNGTLNTEILSLPTLNITFTTSIAHVISGNFTYILSLAEQPEEDITVHLAMTIGPTGVSATLNTTSITFTPVNYTQVFVYGSVTQPGAGYGDLGFIFIQGTNYTLDPKPKILVKGGE